METFPKLLLHQIALMRADINTGHVLDDTYKIAVNDTQKVYTIFESVETALNYARQILTENKSIEVVIYNMNHELLYYLNSPPATQK